MKEKETNAVFSLAFLVKGLPDKRERECVCVIYA